MRYGFIQNKLKHETAEQYLKRKLSKKKLNENSKEKIKNEK